MKIRNVHQRVIPAPIEEVGPLLETLASKEDKIWSRKWPPIRFREGMEIGKPGGHGPIRYIIESYSKAKSIHFRFTKPEGFQGVHFFEFFQMSDQETLVRHEVNMETTGKAVWSWMMIYGPLHDALIEDTFDRIESNFQAPSNPNTWSPWVKFLRYLLK